jgi:two-component system, cell cycle sensor histidine kinase and response regulator CckA
MWRDTERSMCVPGILESDQHSEMDTPNEQARRMEALERLAAGVAHDFNNCLTVILGYSELLIEMVPDGDPTRAMIDDIANAARRGRALTRELMYFSGWQPARPQLVNIGEQLATLSAQLRHLIPDGVSLKVVAADPSLQVVGDPDQLAHMLVGLTLNARDRLRSGGALQIEASRHVRNAESAAGVPLEPGEYVLIRVTDTGEPMDAVARAHVFEPFFTQKRPGKGAGLRLAAAFGIVKTFGGVITIGSGLVDGSRFDVYLPLAGAQPSAEVSTTPRAAADNSCLNRAAD